MTGQARKEKATPVPRLTVVLDSTSGSLAEALTHRLVQRGQRVLTFHISSTRPGLIALLQAFRTFEETGWAIHTVRPDNTEIAFSLADRLEPAVLIFVARPGEVFSFPSKGAVRVQLNDEDRDEAALVRELLEAVQWARRHDRSQIWAEVMDEASTELAGPPAASV